MKKVILILPLMLLSILVYAQGNQGGGREPAGGRAPAGERSGREGGGQNGREGGGRGKDSPGRTSVSKGAIDNAKEIKAINSIDGKGTSMTSGQKASAERQLEAARVQAASENRKADAKHYEKEVKGIKKK